ncbi:MAG TPA: 50S ribosomal protein L4 [Candidatus Saccharimonadales bacterium]|nr:50S ribosomal protein L4 [Candidatus Saccharimonadales bacterium]
MAVSTYTSSGAKATTAAKLEASVFGVMPENHELLKLAYVAYLANGRENLAVTKTRGLVSGGGKKPWKQKGTGRARFGSTRNPIWRGGGIAFGPTGEENYRLKMHVGAKRLAIRQALSLAADENRIKVVEDFAFDSKVKSTVAFLQKIDAKGSVLVVTDVKDDKSDRATSNLQNVKVVHAQYLNVYDILNSDVIVISKPALKLVQEWLGKAAKAKEAK